MADTAYLCVSGYKEIVLLRRLPSQHKQHAIDMFDWCNPKPGHNNNIAWPNNTIIRDWQKMK